MGYGIYTRVKLLLGYGVKKFSGIRDAYEYRRIPDIWYYVFGILDARFGPLGDKNILWDTGYHASKNE